MTRPYERVQKFFTKPSLTRRSEVVNTDLKALVRRYGGVNAVSNAALPPNLFQDLSTLPVDRIDALQRIQAAQEAFAKLPLKVRQAIDHDPRRLEDWIRANPQLSEQYGLLAVKPPAPLPENPEPPAGGDVDPAA